MIENIIFMVLLYLYASFSEYIAHRYLMHNKVDILDFIYDDHRKHHGAYPTGKFNQSRSKYRYLNLALCIEHGLIFMIPLALVVAIFSPIHAIVIVAFVFIHKKMYSDFHSAMHLRHPIRYMPKCIQEMSFWNHFMHHQHPDKFFCVVFPGVDYIFGTVCKPTEPDKIEWEEIKQSMGTSNNMEEDYKEIGKIDLCLIPTIVVKKLFGYIFNKLENTYIPEVVIEGLDNIPDCPAIFIANHGSWKDIFLIRKLRKDINLMAAKGVMDYCFGFGGYIFSMFFNSYPADKKAIDYSVSLLEQGKSIGVFPEGWAYLDGSVHSFKKGISVIHDKTKTVPVIPIGIKYDYYPKEWIIKLPPILQYIISLFIPKYKCRVVMKVGNPIVWGGKKSYYKHIKNIRRVHERSLQMKHQEFTDELYKAVKELL